MDPSKGKKKGKGKRGPTKLIDETRDLALDRPIEEVEYDEYGTPMNRVGIQMVSYEGTCTRYKVPINIKDWRKVDRTIKDALWATIQVNAQFYLVHKVIFNCYF